MKEATITPFAKPLYVMTKPVGAVCNLACDYCYYLEKAKLYELNRKPCLKCCSLGMEVKP